MAKFFVIDSTARTAIVYGDQVHLRLYVSSEEERLGAKGLYDTARTAEYPTAASLRASCLLESFQAAADEVIAKAAANPTVTAFAAIEGTHALRKIN